MRIIENSEHLFEIESHLGDDNHLCIKRHPLDCSCIIPSLKRQLTNLKVFKNIKKKELSRFFVAHLLATWVVEIEGHSLHPGVVSIARIIHITPDNDISDHLIVG